MSVRTHFALADVLVLLRRVPDLDCWVHKVKISHLDLDSGRAAVKTRERTGPNVLPPFGLSRLAIRRDDGAAGRLRDMSLCRW
jgi:hypothetical protein